MATAATASSKLLGAWKLELGTWSFIALEPVLDPELQDARITAHRQNASERGRQQVRVRCSPVEVVRHVERLETELDVLRTGERYDSRERKVDLPERRARQAVAHEVAERPGIGLRERRTIQEIGRASCRERV